MKIEIDFAVLKENQLSADDYIFLYLIFRKGYNYFTTLVLRPNIDKLQEDGYIELGKNIDEHKVTDKFTNLFVGDYDNMFDDLINTYPFKVQGKYGIRILHAKDPKAGANKKSRNRYKKIVINKPYLHKHIMNCLSIQLKIDADRLEFMQNLETWINNRTWEKYENLDDNDKKLSTPNRITRNL